MSCDDRQLQCYRDGELTPAEQAAFEAHLAQCPVCRASLARMETLGGCLREWQTEAEAYGAELSVWDNIRGDIISPELKVDEFEIHQKPRVPVRWAVWSVLAAASIVAGIFLFSRPERLPSNYCQINSASAPGHNLMIYQQPGDGLTVIWLQE